MKNFIAYSKKFGGFIKHGEAPEKHKTTGNVELIVNPNDLSICTALGRIIVDYEAVPLFASGFETNEGEDIYEGFEISAKAWDKGKQCELYDGIVIMDAGCFSLLITKKWTATNGYDIGGRPPMYDFFEFKFTGRNIYENAALNKAFHSMQKNYKDAKKEIKK